MSSPVRLRGEVGERRREPSTYVYQREDGHYAASRRGLDRRQSPSIAARVDECIEAAKAPLLQALEEAAVKIASLEGRVAGLQEALELNLARYRAQEGSYDEGA